MGIRSISNRMYDERELYHKLGPSAGEGGATSSEEIELRQVEVGHSTLPHVYHYLESIMSLPGGVQNTREGQPPVNGKSPSQANQVSTNNCGMLIYILSKSNSSMKGMHWHCILFCEFQATPL